MRITLDVSNDDAAYTAALLYLNLTGKSETPLYQQVRETGKAGRFNTLVIEDEEDGRNVLDHLANPDGSVTTMKQVLGKLGYDPIKLIIAEKERA